MNQSNSLNEQTSTQSGPLLSERLTAVIRAVPGVTTVYRSTPLLAGLVAATAALAPGGRAQPPLALVDQSSGATIVTVTIGVGDGQAAPEICGSVHDSIADYLSESGAPEPFIIRVTIGSISA